MEDVIQASTFVARRKALRMTQAHLATAASVSRSTIRRAERGLPVSYENVRSMCAVLGLDIAAAAVAGDRGSHAPAPGLSEAVPVEVATSLGYPGLLHATGSLWTSFFFAVLSVMLVGPWMQGVVASWGKGTAWAQAWLETLLPVHLVLVAVSMPFAVMHDERRLRLNGDGRAVAANTLARASVVAAGCFLYAALVDPLLRAVLLER